MIHMERQGPQQKRPGCQEGTPGELPRRKNALQGTIGQTLVPQSKDPTDSSKSWNRITPTTYQ